MSSPQHPAQLRPGDRIREYLIERAISEGGFSLVFLVTLHGVFYAVKMATTPASADGPDRVDGWMRREVASLERIVHPNLLPVYEMGRWPDPRTGYSFYVTEYVPGATFNVWRRRSGATPFQWVGVLCEVLRALEALHEQGMFHRDFKADNVLVRDGDGHPFLIDLGSAHVPGARPLTEGVAPGTLYCQPPEVVAFIFSLALLEPESRLEAHPSADLYGVGVLLYEALTDEYPFDPKLPLNELLPAILHTTPPSPCQLSPRAPASLVALCMRLLAKEPQARPSSVQAVREELERLRAEEGHTEPWQLPAVPLPPQAPPPPAQEEAPRPPVSSPEEKKSEGHGRASPPPPWLRAVALLALGSMLLLALGWVLLHERPGADTWRTFLLAEPTVPVWASAPRTEGAPPVQSPHDTQASQVFPRPSSDSSHRCTLLRAMVGSMAVAQLVGCATTPPPGRPDPLGYLARCSTEARITPRTLGFQPYLRSLGPDGYWYPTFLESVTPASSQSVEDGGPVNIRSGPILATMRPLVHGKEGQEFIVAGEAIVTPSRVYIELNRIQLPDGSWLPFCGVASEVYTNQFGLPTYAAERTAVTPLDPALVDSRPGSVVLNEPRFETFVQPADPSVRPSFLRMPPEPR